MRGSWRIGTLSGIGVFVHWSFAVLPALIGFSTFSAAGPAAAIEAVIFVCAVFGCIVLHELGHALMARRFGIGTRDITLLPIGGIARLDRMPRLPRQELAIALAGPAVNVMIAVALFAVLFSSGAVTLTDPGQFLVRLMWTNVALVLFNLLPAFPMDGGRVLRSLLAMAIPYERATRVAAVVGQTLAVGLGILGLFTSWMLILLALFVFVAARAEAKMVQSHPGLSGIRVGEVMQRTFLTLHASETLDQAAARVLFSSQHDFPVVYNGALAGMLTRENVQRALSMGEGGRFVGEMMRRDVPTIDQHEPLGETFERMRQGRFSSVPVSANGLLVGLLSVEQIARWLHALTPLNRPAGAAS